MPRNLWHMIQELKIRNFLSFRDEVILSFEATKDNTFEDCQVVEVAKGVRLLRFALIYGANASGKSNLLSALDFLHDFWFERKEDLDQSTDAVPFLLDTETPTEPSSSKKGSYLKSSSIIKLFNLLCCSAETCKMDSP